MNDIFLPNLPQDAQGKARRSVRDLSQEALVEHVIALRSLCGLLLTRFNDFNNRGETTQALEDRLVAIEKEVGLHDRRLDAQFANLQQIASHAVDVESFIVRLDHRMDQLQEKKQ